MLEFYKMFFLLLLKYLAVFLLEEVFRTIKLRNHENVPSPWWFLGPLEPLDSHSSFRNNKSSRIFGFISQTSPLPKVPHSLPHCSSLFLHPLPIFVKKSFVKKLPSCACFIRQESADFTKHKLCSTTNFVSWSSYGLC